VNYPNHILKTYKNPLSHKNRGMDLEEELNLSNAYYLEKDKALIFKKPTPIGVTNVSYSQQGKIIERAFFKEPSTLDYNGLYRGKYIEFEAKVTQNKTSFPLANIHAHQIKHIESVLRHKGIVFLILKMNDIVYLLKGDDFLNYLDTHERKSIDYAFIKEMGFVIPYGLNPPLDYLRTVNYIYFKEDIYGEIENT